MTEVVTLTSEEAAGALRFEERSTLIFIDVWHDYEEVRLDLELWARHLSASGVNVAVHDSMRYATKPWPRPDDVGCLAVGEAQATEWQRVAPVESLTVLRPPPATDRLGSPTPHGEQASRSEPG
jgi:hypothetical protein